VIGAFGWGLVAGSAFVLGAVLALRLNLSSRSVGLLTAFGAGALFGAVAYELVGKAGRITDGPGRIGIGLIAGSLLYLFATGYWESTDEHLDVNFRSMVVIVIPEAVIIVGSLLTHDDHISLPVISAVFLCGVPEAFLATGRLTRFGLSPPTVMLVWAALAGLCGVSAAVAYALLDHTNEGRLVVVLAVAGGAVLTELTTELVPEARALAGPLAGTAVVIGFALVFGLVEVA
jgi:zinc transporter, ZIP family